MKWILVALVMHTPVKTDLVFDSLGTCLGAEREMRQVWVDAINRTIEAQKTSSMSSDEKEKNLNFVMAQSISGTCIPSR